MGIQIYTTGLFGTRLIKKQNLLAQNITSNKEITSPDWYWYWYWLVDTYNRKCNFPMSPSMSVGRSVDSVLVGQSAVCHKFQKGPEATLPCPYRSTFYLMSKNGSIDYCTLLLAGQTSFQGCCKGFLRPGPPPPSCPSSLITSLIFSLKNHVKREMLICFLKVI